MDPTSTAARTGTQGGRIPGQEEASPRREDQTESVVDEAVDAARKVYNEGGRYLREGWDKLPADMDRYVSRPVQENPLIGIAIAGAVGYLIAYLIHGGGLQWSGSGVPDYARTRDRYRY